MALSATEQAQVEAAVDAFLASPNVQTTVTNIIASGETAAVSAVDTIINNAKVGGLLGSIFTALKGSAEAELNTFVASLPPAAIATLATNAVEGELKTLLGA